MRVDLLNLGIGNICSVKNWLETYQCDVRLVSKVNDLSSELVVMPGVGSAGRFMDVLTNTGFDVAVKDHVEKGKRLLGICLGFQVMMKGTEEDGGVSGLGLLNGHVEKLGGRQTHNGWESLNIDFRRTISSSYWRKKKLTKKQLLNGRVFFNHEYGVISNSLNCSSIPISLELEKYSSLIIKDNIIGMQFHPEKSQITGTDLLKVIL